MADEKISTLPTHAPSISAEQPHRIATTASRRAEATPTGRRRDQVIYCQYRQNDRICVVTSLRKLDSSTVMNGGSMSGLDEAKVTVSDGSTGMGWAYKPRSSGAADVVQVQFGALRAQVEVGAKQGSDLGHQDRILGGIVGWLPADRAPDVFGEHLGRLVAEVAEQHPGAGGGPGGEVRGTVLAKLKLADPRKKPIDHCLAVRAYLWQRLLAVAVPAHPFSPAQIGDGAQEQQRPDHLSHARSAAEAEVHAER